jgi:hypothetical protein
MEFSFAQSLHVEHGGSPTPLDRLSLFSETRFLKRPSERTLATHHFWRGDEFLQTLSNRFSYMRTINLFVVQAATSAT